MSDISPFDNFHVVLVEPQTSRNVGSTARAMMNLGFRHLHLVAPRGYDRAAADVTAVWATPVLDAARIHDTLEEAVAPMREVVALSEREGRNPAYFVTLPEWSGRLPTRAARETALVFGPEDSGLRQEHLNQCSWVVRIPSTAAFPSFNLAQSVLVVLYEITRTFGDDVSAFLPAVPVKGDSQTPGVPTWNDFHQLDRLLDSVMREGGFIRGGSPLPAPDMVKNLFKRMELNTHEIGLLMSLFGRLQTTLTRRGGDGSGTEPGETASIKEEPPRRT